MVKVHRGMRSTLAGKQDAEIDVIQTEACPKDPKLARHSDGHCELCFFLVLFTIIELF